MEKYVECHQSFWSRPGLTGHFELGPDWLYRVYLERDDSGIRCVLEEGLSISVYAVMCYHSLFDVADQRNALVLAATCYHSLLGHHALFYVGLAVGIPMGPHAFPFP